MLIFTFLSTFLKYMGVAALWTLHVIPEYGGGFMFHPSLQIDAKTLSDRG